MQTQGKQRHVSLWRSLNSGEILVSSRILYDLLCVSKEERGRGREQGPHLGFCAPHSQTASQLIPLRVLTTQVWEVIRVTILHRRKTKAQGVK